MIWDDYSRIVKPGDHAVFPPSQYSWRNYTPEKLLHVYRNKQAAKKGTEDHEFASLCIKRRQRLWKCKRTLESFVNDAIGFGMESEKLLYYSNYFFGWTDAIVYKEKEKVLRIHDLKTGETPGSFHQLEIYAALFFLQYGDRLNAHPNNTTTLLRIYQFDTFEEVETPSEVLEDVMETIVLFNKILVNEDSEGLVMSG